MLDLIKKGLEAAISGISDTQEKMKELADELVLKGHLTKKEGGDLVKSVQGTVKDTQKKIASLVDDQVRKVMKEVGVATSADIKKLKGKIEKLEKELKKEKKKPTKKTDSKKSEEKKSKTKKKDKS